MRLLSQIKGGQFNTRKEAQFSDRSYAPTSGTAVRIWKDKAKQESILRGAVSIKIGPDKGLVPVHMGQASKTIETLQKIAQGDQYLKDLPTGQFCVHGDLKVCPERANLLLIDNERITINPVVQATYPSAEHGGKLRTSSGVISAADLARQSVMLHYMGRKIETVSIGSRKQILFLGAHFNTPEDAVWLTLEDLREAPIYRDDSRVMVLPQISTYNALALFRALYFFYEAHCSYYDKELKIEFPNRINAGEWAEFMPISDASIDVV